MAVKQTIAWIGNIKQQEDILAKLAEHYRVLLVNKEGSAITALSQKLQSEVEIIDCVKDGCWEADIIVVTEEEIQEDLLVKVREVATQKIVLLITRTDKEGRHEGKLAQICKALPFSKIAAANLHPEETLLLGNNPAALSTASEMIRRLGFKIGGVRNET